MDVIELKVGRQRIFGHRQLRIFVNGRSLVDRVQEIEKPIADADGTPWLVASYQWPPAEELLPPSRRLLGVPDSPDDVDRKVDVLICECGDPGCWSLVVTIETRDDVVVWRDFEQPHRRDRWSYERLGPFVFDRALYEAELIAAARALAGPRHEPD